MNPEQYGLVQELFHAASEREPKDRAAYLDRVCAGDASLRAYVEALLGEDAKSDSFMERPAVVGGLEIPNIAAQAMEQVATVRGGCDGTRETIGPYRILEILGEGGMGTVYLAEQQEPVRRQVALKLIRLGMDTKQVIARFEAERQALALMSHPNIARVFDAGSSDDGRLYFVMEHVSGVPITTYADQRKLGVESRLELFIQVCRGVLHAHQKGIIHRDIKPSNVLVQNHDGESVPKIIDFGIAKATSHRLTERTLCTEEGHMIGTPEYMSPEQAEMTGLRVDTRTDVYSLGVLLYELLVGRLPFDPAELRRAGLCEIQRKIREDEPLKPSTRLSTADDTSTDAAHNRRTDTITLCRQLRGDLDWITMKAIEKDPTLRYQSASELAADIGRHLKHEPVEAGAPSAWYRMRKFLRRYNVQATAALAVFLMLFVGIIVSWTQYVRAEENARIANENEARANDKIEEAKRERNRAQDKTREAVAHLGMFDLVSLVVELEKASPEENNLYPAWPGQVEAMRKWLREAGEPLASALPRVEIALAELRKKALEYTPAPRRERHADAKIAADGGYEFADGRNQFLHRTLTNLARNLKSLLDPRNGAIASMEERLAWAESISARSIEDYREQWNEACAAIAASDGVRASKLYRGFELRPQIGLVPIGMDPESKLWEFAHLRSGTVPVRDTDRLRVDGESGLVFVLIPGGRFYMGAQNEDANKPNYEPQSERRASMVKRIELSAYFLSRYEMTQGQWKRLSGGEEPSYYNQGETWASHKITWANPVEHVSWEMCDQLLRRHRLVLPTEAQWEYACRAGTTTPWSTGVEATSLRGHVNLADRHANRAGSWYVQLQTIEPWLDDGHVVHAPIGSFRPNPFGLFDMHGNVAEWCRDRFGGYDLDVAPGDGLRQVSGFPRFAQATSFPLMTATVSGSRQRVQRGGSFWVPAAGARSAQRGGDAPRSRDGTRGLRPARAVTESLSITIPQHPGLHDVKPRTTRDRRR